ncbi:ERF family protein [Azospirillum sp.]|uniref:ERF family protein n=1 Tax=Azospirillum sp. TaxID=34012 RepID=UPI003D755EB4
MNNAMPVELAAAINDVMAGVKTLGKDGNNQHQRYDFVSTDKFLAAVNPLCAAAGLVILQDEESVEVATQESTDQYGKTKTQAWLTARYSFMLAHKSGAVYGPLRRTVMVLANGAQAFGSAQSYALKQFMRSLFQISTGDKDDADLQPADDLPHARRDAKATPPRHDVPKSNGTDPQAIASAIKHAIDAAADIEALNADMRRFGFRPGSNNPSAGSDLAKVKEHSEQAFKFLIDRAANKRSTYVGEEATAMAAE